YVFGQAKLIFSRCRGQRDRALPPSRRPPSATARLRVLVANKQRSLSAQHNKKPVSLRLLPQSLEPAPGYAGVVHGMPRVRVAEVVLHAAQGGAPVGQVEAAGVPERVGMHVPEAGALSCRTDQVVYGLARQRLAALGDEQPRKLVGACGEVALDG